MTWNPTPLEDGDAATAASINDRLTGARDWINDLDGNAIRRGAFNRYHAGKLLPSATIAQLTASGDHGYMVYDRATFGVSMNYTALGTNDGTETAASYTGDRAIIGHPDAAAAGSPYSGGLAKLTMPLGGYRIGMDAGDRVCGILCRSNVQVRKMVRGAAGTNMEVMVCWQFRLNSAGTWWTIPETESFVSFTDHVISDTSAIELMDIDIPIANVLYPITVSAIAGGSSTDRVSHFRMMCSMVNSVAAGPASQLWIHRWNMSAIPFHAKLG